jgi:hypothetical protein
MKHTTLFFTVLVLFLQGCANSTVDIKPEKQISMATKGIVYGLLTQGGGDDGWLHLRKKGGSEGIRLEATGTGLIPSRDINERDRKGKLFVVELDPGIYEITSWTFSMRQGSYIPTFFMPENLEPIEFTVEAGKATYLGSFHIHTVKLKTKIGFFTPLPNVTATCDIEDQFKRDTALLHSKYPKLHHIKAKQAVPEQSVWTSRRVRRI